MIDACTCDLKAGTLLTWRGSLFAKNSKRYGGMPKYIINNVDRNFRSAPCTLFLLGNCYTNIDQIITRKFQITKLQAIHWKDRNMTDELRKIYFGLTYYNILRAESLITFDAKELKRPEK